MSNDETQWELERITVSLIPKASKELRELSAPPHGFSRSDVVNRAISVYAFMQDQLDAGREIAIHDPATGATRVVHIR